MLGSAVGEGTLVPRSPPHLAPVTAPPVQSWAPQGVALHIRCHQRSHLFVSSAVVEFLVHFLV